MISISKIKIEGLEKDIVTDRKPIISFSLESDVAGEELKKAVIIVNDWTVETTDQINNVYTGPLKPFTRYDVKVIATGSSGESCEKDSYFTTGRLEEPWKALWITDISYRYSNKESPIPMTFRKVFTLKNKVIKRAWINSTAFGIYELCLNGNKVGNDYFAPGFTSYDNQLQYQTYDIKENLKEINELYVVVGGGWAAGSYNYNRKSQISADRQAFLCEICIEYEDGTYQIIGSNSSWEVTLEGPYRTGDWYDGEEYDATRDYKDVCWKNADCTEPRCHTKLVAQYGAFVRKNETLYPQYVLTTADGEHIYDFGQNFAGVISAKINGEKGKKIVFRHAEVLVDNTLFVKSLRTAKATATYTCIDGEQQYSPRFTYMGFRYVGVTGIARDKIELSGFVLHSNIDDNGDFSCSNKLINQLQSNIRWGGKSNFVDIPTDCPQRDERLGWTGDIAVFARTACYNFDMSRFLDKWLTDMRFEQGEGGGLPMVIPRAGDAWPVMATSCWGDSCILVPWAEYLARGNKRLLEEHYNSMKRFMKAAKWWANFLSITPTKRYIWSMPFHWGDWCAPTGCAKDWIGRSKWIATAYYYNSCRIMAQISDILGKSSDVEYYLKLSLKISKAYMKAFTDGKGTLKKKFQTGYVLPLYFEMADKKEANKMVENLVQLIEDEGFHLSTGFPGTPYILFALSDNGRSDIAYKLLLQETCPSWLYEVKCDATTIWERWDALREDGTVNMVELSGKEKSEEDSSGGMVSFNHYANGAVGDWLYRRCLGVEAQLGGYKEFVVAPVIGGNLSWVKGSVMTPYGKIEVKWNMKGSDFEIFVSVPVSTKCTLKMPDGKIITLFSGNHKRTCRIERSDVLK